MLQAAFDLPNAVLDEGLRQREPPNQPRRGTKPLSPRKVFDGAVKLGQRYDRRLKLR